MSQALVSSSPMNRSYLDIWGVQDFDRSGHEDKIASRTQAPPQQSKSIQWKLNPQIKNA